MPTNTKSPTATKNISKFVEIKAFRDDVVMPTKGTSKAAGYDLCAWLKDNYDNRTIIPSGGSLIVKTGLNVNIPENYEIQIRPRSGLAAKHMVSVLNTPGTIDSDYCGDGEDFELKVIMVNHGRMPFAIGHGERIAQMVICELPMVDLKVVDEFSSSSNTDRSGGLGSTGV
jgi:dUTP pyrophosphatase